MQGENLACATIYGAAMVMVGQLRINRARRGEIFFARTSVVRRRVAGARSKRVGNCASIADGRKIFRLYKCGALLNLACATICGVEMVMVGRLRLNAARTGEKYFAPTHAARGYIGRAPRFGVRRWLMVG